MRTFKKHPDQIMGIYVEPVKDDPFGRTEIEYCFNRSENPELDEAYTAWLAKQPESAS